MNYKSLFKKYPSIISAYLFGSRARGNNTPSSDYDFSVHLDEKRLSRKKYTDVKLKIMADLNRALKTDKIDVVVLNDAPILLKHRILKDRKVIFCRSDLKRVRNEARILSDYLDQKESEVAYAKGVFEGFLKG